LSADQDESPTKNAFEGLQVMNNSFYSFWFYFQINKPLDRAVWWIEHIMRHPTLYSRRSPVHNLAWYQYLLLDVLAFYAAIVFFFGWIIFKIFVCCCCRKKSLKSKKD
jgi:hypothetical protein